MLIKSLLLLVLLASTACSHTANATGANGVHCQSVSSGFLFSAHVTTQCWNANGKLISHSEGN